MNSKNKPLKIILIIFDSLRKDHTGKIYGNDWIHTPNFDKFANDCIVFDKAYPESLPTIPARRSIYTGIRTIHYFTKPPVNYRTDDLVVLLGRIPGWYPIPHDQKNISEYMNRLGYDPALISSLYHQFKPNMNFHLGFSQWNWIRGHETDKFRMGLPKEMTLDQMKNETESKLSTYSLVSTDEIIETMEKKLHVLKVDAYLRNDLTLDDDHIPNQTFSKAIEFIGETLHKQVFLLIEEFAPHEPWSPVLKYRDLYLDNYTGNNIIEPRYKDSVDYLTNDELRCLRANYAGDVTQCDVAFGKFIDYLKNKGLYDDSLIIMTSDHGFSIGEHDYIGKIPLAMYPELVDIPFFIKPPGNIDGPKRISKSYVYHHDILPTIFGFLNEPIPEIFEGKDLSIFVQREDHLIKSRDYITIGMHAASLYKDDHWALITTNDSTIQKLYNVKEDAEWNENVSENHLGVIDKCLDRIKADVKGSLYQQEGVDAAKMMEWYQIISDHEIDWER
ncbi:MAG: sulfatase [Candidatus Hodarchaeales archaeon]